MHLPNEIILLLLKPLEKHDLKSARLVSKIWNPLAAELLFDQVYVSAHPENLEIFSAIARHPLLSQCIKTLRYDAVEFVEACTKKQYFWSLYDQTRCRFWMPDLEQLEDSTLCSSINRLVELVMSPDDDLYSSPHASLFLELGWETCKDYDFVSHGYQEYQKCAALQHAQFDNGTFLESLIGGLQTLDNLSCVILDGRWTFPQEVLHDPEQVFLKRQTGSPLARGWNIFHTCPRAWEFKPHQPPQGSTPICGATDGADHYWTIIAALLRSQRKIQIFKMGDQSFCMFPPTVFDRTQKERLSFYGLDTVAFSELQILKLSIARYGGRNTPKLFPNIDGLRFLLRSMHHLRVLDLKFPKYSRNRTALYNSSQVFPQGGQWDQMTSLSLYAISSSAADFLTLVTRKMPALSHLQLGIIGLDIGDWEGVIECMEHSMHLSRFKIVAGTQFYHRGATKFFDDEKHGPKRDEIEKYVMSGGRHPCLRPDQSDSTAMFYITADIQDFY